jgi:hypothetical protein
MQSGMIMAAADRGKRSVITSQESNVSVTLNESSLFGPSFVFLAEAEYEKMMSNPADGLELRSTPIVMGPLSLAVRSTFGIHFIPDVPPDERDAVYSWDEKKKEWNFCASEPAGDTLTAFVSSPGIYGVLADVSSPHIGNPDVVKYESYATGGELPVIVIPIDDLGSGVDDWHTRVYIDGNSMIGRWDSFSKKMFILLWEKNIMGWHDLSVAAYDRAGNVSHLHTTLEIPSFEMDKK